MFIKGFVNLVTLSMTIGGQRGVGGEGGGAVSMALLVGVGCDAGGYARGTPYV